MQKLERHLIARDNFVYLFIIFLLLFFCPFPHFHYHWNILGFPLAPLVFWISNGYIFILHIHRQMSVISNGSDVVKKNWPLKGEASRPSASKEKAIFHCPSHLILILIRTHHSHRERERERERERGGSSTQICLISIQDQRRISHKWRQELFNNNKPEVLCFWILVFFWVSASCFYQNIESFVVWSSGVLFQVLL